CEQKESKRAVKGDLPAKRAGGRASANQRRSPTRDRSPSIATKGSGAVGANSFARSAKRTVDGRMNSALQAGPGEQCEPGSSVREPASGTDTRCMHAAMRATALLLRRA